MVTQKGDNTFVVGIHGNFDDAQSGVKAIFSDRALEARMAEAGFQFSSANSINIGRLVPQVVYYVYAYVKLLENGELSEGEPLNVVVPTGNFGNILAAYLAKGIGVPLAKLICASNENKVLYDFFQTGTYDKNRPFVLTSSPSMDILISSNLERLLYAFSGEDDKLVADYMAQLNASGRYEVNDAIKAQIHDQFAAGFTSEEETEETIGKMWKEKNYLIDTHSAVAFHVLEQYRKETGDNTVAVVASTASPFKFGDAVLKAIGVDDVKSGVALLDQLAEVSGIPAPAPLAALKTKTPRFDQCVEKENMEQAVLGFLS